jgi:hypothetical protein
VKSFATLVTVGPLWFVMMSPAHARDDLRLTSGALEFIDNDRGTIDVRAQSDFSMHAFVFESGGIYRPGDQCSFPECVPGTNVSLFALWSGNDVSGTATLRGHDYVLSSEAADGAAAIVQFDGNVILPDFTSTGTADVSAPFTFVGQIHIEATGETMPLTGSGTATLHLLMSQEGPNWNIVSATYQFERAKTTSTQAAQH